MKEIESVVKYSKHELAKLPFRDETLELEDRVEDLLGRLTLKEKFRLMAGHKVWVTKPIKRLEIPEFGMTDGPCGVAWHSSKFKKSTQFPTSICLAASWNRNNSYDLGIATAAEVRDVGRHVILGPGINVHRTPLNGRTFEYLSEDPYLIREMAIPFVKATQSQRISTCVKHYVANNQETHRMSSSSEINERALHEIYLRGFRDVVQKADPWSVMGSYNKINGIFGCANKELVRDTLMDQWGFRGFLVTDWTATKGIKTTEACVNAGLSLEMPLALRYTPKRLQKSYLAGKFTDEALNDVVKRLLRVMFLVGIFDDYASLPVGSRNTTEHQNVARRIAEEGIVLLKNDRDLLPLELCALKKIAVLGPNAKKKWANVFMGVVWRLFLHTKSPLSKE